MNVLDSGSDGLIVHFAGNVTSSSVLVDSRDSVLHCACIVVNPVGTAATHGLQSVLKLRPEASF